MIRKVARQQKVSMALNNYIKTYIFSKLSKVIAIHHFLRNLSMRPSLFFIFFIFFVSCSSQEKMNNVDNSSAFDVKLDRTFIKEKVKDIASANDLIDRKKYHIIEVVLRIYFTVKR